MFVQSSSVDILVNKWEEFEKEIDLLYTNGHSNKEHIEVKDWEYDLNSTQFRMRNNYIASFLELV